MPSVRRLTLALALVGALAPAVPPPAAAGVAVAEAPSAAPAARARALERALRETLRSSMRLAGRAAGAYVVNLSHGRVAFRWLPRRARVLASNTKLFTTSAALARFGTEGTLATEVLGDGALDADGTWRGSLYLRGGGDPTFGSRHFARSHYGEGASVEELAEQLAGVGIERVAGRILGDESAFDSLRGGPESGFGLSPWVGPLSALSFNRGLVDERGSGFQTSPPLFAAGRLDAALERRGVRVRRAPGARRAPPGLELLAAVESPPMRLLVRITGKQSDNFFAEQLLKAMARQLSGRGTTGMGARIAARFARRLGASARLVDGSGLSRGNRASPAAVVRLLAAMTRRDEYDAFVDGLAIAGRDGTLADRMRTGPARQRCRGKTGTLSDVSALSGYCEARSGDTYAFSILMNGVYPTGARRLQDRMLQAIAAIPPG